MKLLKKVWAWYTEKPKLLKMIMFLSGGYLTFALSVSVVHGDFLSLPVLGCIAVIFFICGTMFAEWRAHKAMLKMMNTHHEEIMRMLRREAGLPAQEPLDDGHVPGGDA